jgi:hypothetical protein
VKKIEQACGSFKLNAAGRIKMEGPAVMHETGRSFIDTEFLPIDRSINGGEEGDMTDRLVHWRRIREFMVS